MESRLKLVKCEGCGARTRGDVEGAKYCLKCISIDPTKCLICGASLEFPYPVALQYYHLESYRKKYGNESDRCDTLIIDHEIPCLLFSHPSGLMSPAVRLKSHMDPTVWRRDWAGLASFAETRRTIPCCPPCLEAKRQHNHVVKQDTWEVVHRSATCL